MVNKARLVEKIAELVHDKRVDGIQRICATNPTAGHAHRHRAEEGRQSADRAQHAL